MTTSQKIVIAAIVVLVGVFGFDTYETYNQSEQKKVLATDAQQNPVSDLATSPKEEVATPATGDAKKHPAATPAVIHYPGGAQKTLSVFSSIHPIQIVEGSDYVFPKDLGSYGIELTETPDGYSIKDTTQGTLIIMSDDNSITTYEVSGNNITITNGVVYTNGHLETASKKGGVSRILEKKTLVIQVPKGSALNINASRQFDLEVRAPLGDVSVDVSGQSKVILGSVQQLKKLELSGQSNVSVASATNVGDVDVSGQSCLKIAAAKKVGGVDVSGQSRVVIPQSAEVASEEVTGQSTLSRK